VAESAGLLIRYVGKPASRVRIPISPPHLKRRSQAGPQAVPLNTQVLGDGGSIRLPGIRSLFSDSPHARFPCFVRSLSCARSSLLRAKPIPLVMLRVQFGGVVCSSLGAS
jgi:hypothetical protein